MSRSQAPIPAGFPTFLKEVKARIQQAQTRAVLSANPHRPWAAPRPHHDTTLPPGQNHHADAT